MFVKAETILGLFVLSALQEYPVHEVEIHFTAHVPL